MGCQNSKRGRGGFALLEITIAMALGIFVLLVVGELLGSSQKSMSDTAIFEEAKISLKRVLDRRVLCDEAFRNEANTAKAKFGAAVIPAQRMGTVVSRSPGSPAPGEMVLQRNSPLLRSLLVVTRLELVPHGTPDATLHPDWTLHPVKLVFEAQRAGDGRVYNNERNPFYLSLAVNNASQRILGCGPL